MGGPLRAALGGDSPPEVTTQKTRAPKGINTTAARSKARLFNAEINGQQGIKASKSDLLDTLQA